MTTSDQNKLSAGIPRVDHGSVHPLDPLSAEEIAATSAAVSRHKDHDPTWRVVFVLLYEPEKAQLRAWQHGSGPKPRREARVTVRDKGRKRTIDLVVDLDRGFIVAAHDVEGIQPAVMREESVEAERLARAHPEWEAALRRRGIEDTSQAMLDHMPLGYQDPGDGPQQRRGIALTWVRGVPPSQNAGAPDVWASDNGYARPVEGLIVHFDLDEMRVLEVVDHGGPPIPSLSGNYGAAALSDPQNSFQRPSPRPSASPLEIRQPEGPSFSVDGREVAWQNWRVRVGFNAREGLVLHDLRYVDAGRERPVVHRASLSEMFVPYADPGVTHWRKQLFDQGEAGIGRCTNSLRLGCDCLGEIFYFDGVINDNDGRPVEIPNAICLHEEDYGLLWKHTNLRTGHADSRRSRRLVISSLTTVGNYDYGFFWYLYQDGRIEFEVKLTGILSTGAYADESPKYGTPLAPNLYGPNHQHWFNVRLDMAVDGDSNTLLEVNSAAVEDSQENFFGGAWRTHETVLSSELKAQRHVDARSARYWRVVNRQSRNRVGQPAGYAVHPGSTAFHFYRPDAPALARARFIDRHLWATKYHRDELFAAGDYPNQHPGGAGLPGWTSRDAGLEDEDLVLWCSFATNHVVRPEDWPIMPVAYAGFELHPEAFFDGNPAVDVPPEAGHHRS